MSDTASLDWAEAVVTLDNALREEGADPAVISYFELVLTEKRKEVICCLLAVCDDFSAV